MTETNNRLIKLEERTRKLAEYIRGELTSIANELIIIRAGMNKKDDYED